MKCNQIESMLECYLDGELTLSDRREFEGHTGTCKSCMRSLQQLEAIKAGIGAVAYEKSPSTLRKKIRYGLRDISNEDGYSATPFQWLSFSGGLMVFIAISAWIVVQFLVLPMRMDDFSDQVVDAHIRSLQVDHLLDVASTDNHTIKPWFTGKIGFAPTVKNLDAKGYQLTGGRIEYLHGKKSAVLVYKRRSHIINVFLFYRHTRTIGSGKRTVKKKGFNLVIGVSAGLETWIVSDLNSTELKDFAKLYTQPALAEH